MESSTLAREPLRSSTSLHGLRGSEFGRRNFALFAFQLLVVVDGAKDSCLPVQPFCTHIVGAPILKALYKESVEERLTPDSLTGVCNSSEGTKVAGFDQTRACELRLLSCSFQVSRVLGHMTQARFITMRMNRVSARLGLRAATTGLPVPSCELGHETQAKAWASWSLEMGATREAGFTEQRPPHAYDSGRITSRCTVGPLGLTGCLKWTATFSFSHFSSFPSPCEEDVLEKGKEIMLKPATIRSYMWRKRARFQIEEGIEGDVGSRVKASLPHLATFASQCKKQIVDPLKDLVFFLFLMRQQERKLQATPKTLQDDEHEKTCRDGCHKNCYNFFSQHLTLRVCNGQGSEREYVFVASIVKVKMEF
ncbi:hypothetical protein RJ640_024433 [Escallonia rubra]|uniref:Uncharacterized protein n=1 Tax=Escallonia rubra TaxID=112253 RepID=A0AA88RXH6_9ASTE|nr:hypothetical protein RJ640_024433 [Escallonia rubra]